MQDDQLLKVVTDCSLNLCAIYSAMDEHYKALKAARKALVTLKSS
jgi:predicted metal-dependent HD superfamily phosphohydrolase